MNSTRRIYLRPLREHRIGRVCGGDPLDVVNTRSDGADRLLDEEQLGAVASKAVVLSHRDVGRLDLGQLAEHQLISRPVCIGAGLRRVFVLIDYDETL